jgi:crotonobetainyl-CoA:carnitine CoA-transferase CaiB-like acyl-CoA transferase
MTPRLYLRMLAMFLVPCALSIVAFGQAPCIGLPSHDALQAALKGAVSLTGGNGGLSNNMWGTSSASSWVAAAARAAGHLAFPPLLFPPRQAD